MSPSLRSDPAFAAADARAAALGSAAHAAIRAAAERVAESSAAVALRAMTAAPEAWTRFGPEGFARWVAFGEELACGEASSREGALAYFAVDPAAFGAGGLATVDAWCAIGRRVARTSRRLAALFFERTAPVLAGDDAIARLDAWATAGLSLHASHGWRGAFLAQAWFEAAPDALGLLAPAHYALWAEVGAALANEPEERDVFAALPAGLAGWSDEEREAFLRLTLGLAAHSARHARTVYRGLPPAVAELPVPVRAALVRATARCDPSLAAGLAAFVPVAGAVVRDVPADARLPALALVDALAARFPVAALAALRVLPVLYEEAAPEQVAIWFASGTAIAADNEAAGRAYFALESRTSLRVLRAASTAAGLEETEGLWRKLIHMLSGEPVTVRGIEGLGLRPPLETLPGEHEVALPLKVDVLPTHEDNCRVYRFLAAQLAGRREFGTYRADGIRAALDAADDGGLLEDLFLLAEGVRVYHRVAATYPGLAGDAVWVGTRLVARWAAEMRPTRGMVLDTLLALVLGAPERPLWLAADGIRFVAATVAPLASPSATATDSLRVAHALADVLAMPAMHLPAADIPAELLLDDITGGEPLGAGGGDDFEPMAPPPATAPVTLELAPDVAERTNGGHPLSAEELRRLIESGARIGQGRGETGAGGIPITELAGKLPRAELDRLRRLLEEGAPAAARPAERPSSDERAFFYDEWDHRIGDYRARWCRLHELALPGDSGEYFTRALSEWAALLPEVRRQFQRIRPEMYRPVRGLEDGEDFDLNAVTEARIEVHARRVPSTRLYRSRVREARDVATLFLLDMSASTDEPLGGDRPGRRIIDALKEALVIMTEALDELGDAYAIYGFSGQGRGNVEFYVVKGFGEALGPPVKARIGGIVPKRSTRMGTALRHAAHKMAAVGARAKHLMLLSDGFPQDDDYGEDRRSHLYGIRDTAVALREADAAGVTPFCITVDRAGHDYLREMCDPSRYMVIDDITTLPRELPKIYRRVVRA